MKWNPQELMYVQYNLDNPTEPYDDYQKFGLSTKRMKITCKHYVNS